MCGPEPRALWTMSPLDRRNQSVARRCHRAKWSCDYSREGEGGGGGREGLLPASYLGWLLSRRCPRNPVFRSPPRGRNANSRPDQPSKLKSQGATNGIEGLCAPPGLSTPPSLGGGSRPLHNGFLFPRKRHVVFTHEQRLLNIAMCHDDLDS